MRTFVIYAMLGIKGIEAMAESHLLQMLETFSKLKVTGLFWERTSGRRLDGCYLHLLVSLISQVIPLAKEHGAGKIGSLGTCWGSYCVIRS